MIESHEGKEKTEESKDSIESTQKEKEEERPRSSTPSARKSPDPSCAICLERLTDKSFTESCYHLFCFTCLLEWSKVKAECPLCKKSFRIIVHNFRSFKEYDQYFVNKTRMTDMRASYTQRFRYRTTLTPDRMHETPLEMESYLSHRMRFAPHSVHSFRISVASSALMPSRRLIPNSFRQRVYDENLWVFPVNSGRIRCISPEFFRQNIACTHRLLPWLNRELLVVMPNNESQVTFVIELIMALIVKYEIRSQEFQTLIEPYTGSHTAHFIHEFYNFAASPFETLDSYDHQAQYDIPQAYERISSPDSDVIPLPMDYSSSTQQGTSNESSRRKKQTHPRKKDSKGSKKLKKLILKKNEKNVWESVTPSYYIPNSVSFEFSGPSTSRGIPFLNSPIHTEPEIDVVNDSDTVEETIDVDDDECEIIDVLKPKKERTPELVNISSDEETAYIVKDLSIEDKEENTIASPAVEVNDTILSVSEDDECEIVYCKEVSETSNDVTAAVADEIVLDKPIDYSLKTIEKKFDTEISAPTVEICSPSTSVNIENDDVYELNKRIDDSKLEIVKPERSTVIKSVICAKPKEEAASSSLQSLLKPKKRRALILDDDSTESCSDGAQGTELETSKKKLKLKSVVAHFSFENSDEHESTHHSSMHKKRRERKKKKRKHKHRRRIYSSDSD